MKEIILSADGDSVLYLVPDAVAENLEEYCLKFCSDWLWNSPEAEKYRVGNAVCYTEADFKGLPLSELIIEADGTAAHTGILF